MNKTITRLFVADEYGCWFRARGDRAPDWLGGFYSMDLCYNAIEQLWDIPRGTRRIWITVSTKPTPGKSYRLKRWKGYDTVYRYNSGRFSFDGTAQAYLGRRFNTPYVYATVEYE